MSASSTFDDEDFEFPSPSFRLIWIAIGTVVVALLGVAFAYVLSDAGEEMDVHHDKANLLKPIVTTPSEPILAEDRSQHPKITGVFILTDPAGASVYEGTQRLGTTPWMVEFQTEDATARDLHLKLEGFDDLQLSVGPEDAPAITRRLIHGQDTAESKILRSPPSIRQGEQRPNPAPKPEILLPDFCKPSGC
jgi:hypothetical protein